MPRSAAWLGAAFTVLILAGAARADDEPPTHHGDDGMRHGITGGFGLGGGSITPECDACDENSVMEAGSFDAHLGVMLSPRVALMGDFWIMGHRDDDLTVTQTIITAAVQFWLHQRFWIKAGVGGAHATWRWDGIITFEDRTETVLGVMGALGFEAVSKRDFALDLQARYGTGFYDNDGSTYDVQAHNFALVLGFSWF